MLTASPRYIHFRTQWQMLGPDSPGQRFERGHFQEFFDRLNSNKEFGGYDDFSYRPDRCELAKARGTAAQGGQAFSKVVYSNDALSLVEEYTDLSTSDFSSKIKVVLGAWFHCFPQTLAIVQICCLRSLVTPSNFSKSYDFLADRVLQMKDGFAARLGD